MASTDRQSGKSSSASVRIKLKYATVEDFVEKFATNLTLNIPGNVQNVINNQTRSDFVIKLVVNTDWHDTNHVFDNLRVF